ncbi:MAG: hypothetical protein HYT39_01020 [Candidatus Sungbacteria bacterium]|nr:hypothetical protein [Candidatus Sungbacteria bacterium]
MNQYFTNKSYDIKKFQHWTLTLHSNQSYLGRCICYLNTYKENIAELTDEEFLEVKKIIKEYQSALTKLWQPDFWNYSQLGNATPHIHFHFVPRYKGKRVFEGTEFIDERWGKNYNPSSSRPEDKKLNEKIRGTIQNVIQE